MSDDGPSPPPLTKEIWDNRREALTRETRLHTARLNASEGAIILMDQFAPMVEALFAERDRLRRELDEMRPVEDEPRPTAQMGD